MIFDCRGSSGCSAFGAAVLFVIVSIGFPFLESPAGKNREERSLSGYGILSLSSPVCPAGSGEQPDDIVVRMGYTASVAQDSLPAGTAEHTGMVEVPVRFADRTAGFLSVDAFFFKSGHFHFPLVR